MQPVTVEVLAPILSDKADRRCTPGPVTLTRYVPGPSVVREPKSRIDIHNDQYANDGLIYKRIQENKQ